MFEHHFSGQLGPKLNREQKIAAVNIIQARNMPLPYLLFGPAGMKWNQISWGILV